MIVRNDSHAVDAVMDSTIVRASRALHDSVIAGWQSSAISRWRHRATSQFATATPAERLRSYALIIATAAATYVVILSALPAYAAPGLPWWWYAALAAGALMMALWARAITEAWPASLPGRCVRYFFS
jgi:hypothetical protein